MQFDFPSQPLDLNSPLYVCRPNVEKLAFEEIDKTGCLICLKGAKGMGKSSMMLRMLAYAQAQNYSTVTIDFRQADQEIYLSLNKFLRWFCANIALQLNFQPCLDEYWDEDVGIKVSSSIYLQHHILEKIDRPLIIALNELNILFEFPHIAQDFFPLLRLWHEEAKRLAIFANLRFILVYSTEHYLALNINQSPFNVGLSLQLPPFNQAQMQELAHRFQLDNLTQEQITILDDMLGGKPLLLSVAFYHLANKKITFDNLVTQASAISGIYGDYLRSYYRLVQDNYQLKNELCKIINNDHSDIIEPLIAYQLKSLGLVKCVKNNLIIANNLYASFFKEKVCNQEIFNQKDNTFINSLQQENEKLKQLAYVDKLTKIGNRAYFDLILEREWRNACFTQNQLSLILLDVDYFKAYNDTYGHFQGDICLQEIAKTIKNSLRRIEDYPCRYGGEEFAIVLSNTNLAGAIIVAKNINQQVQNLAIQHINTGIEAKIVTVSMGVCTMIPTFGVSSRVMIESADQALYKSKNEGRNKINFINLTFEN